MKRPPLTYTQDALRQLRGADTSWAYALSLEPHTPAQRAAIVKARTLLHVAIQDAARVVEGERP